MFHTVSIGRATMWQLWGLHPISDFAPATTKTHTVESDGFVRPALEIPIVASCRFGAKSLAL